MIKGSNSAPVPAGAQARLVAGGAGYVMEIVIPMSQLGITVANGRQFGLEMQINDDDDGGDRDTKLAWWSTTDDTWRYPSLFGTAVLNDALAPTPTPIPPTPIPPTPIPPTPIPRNAHSANAHSADAHSTNAHSADAGSANRHADQRIALAMGYGKHR